MWSSPDFDSINTDGVKPRIPRAKFFLLIVSIPYFSKIYKSLSQERKYCIAVSKELWYGNIAPQDDSRNNSPEMKQLMEYMSRHHDDLLKSMTDEQKEIFEKFDD